MTERDTSKGLCVFGGSVMHSARRRCGTDQGRQAGLFDIEERLGDLSAKGDELERINALVNFEAFRSELERAVPRSDRARGGRPPYDHV